MSFQPKQHLAQLRPPSDQHGQTSNFDSLIMWSWTLCDTALSCDVMLSKSVDKSRHHSAYCDPPPPYHTPSNYHKNVTQKLLADAFGLHGCLRLQTLGIRAAPLFQLVVLWSCKRHWMRFAAHLWILGKNGKNEPPEPIRGLLSFCEVYEQIIQPQKHPRKKWGSSLQTMKKLCKDHPSGSQPLQER